MAIAIRNFERNAWRGVSGIDLSKPVARDDVKTIEDVWNQRLVVVFHGHRSRTRSSSRFSKNFGELDPPGPNPYREPFTGNIRAQRHLQRRAVNGKPIGNLGDGEAVGTADMTYVDVPPKAAMLAFAGNTTHRRQHAFCQHVCSL